MKITPEQNFIIDEMQIVSPRTAKIYKELFDSMTEEEYHDWYKRHFVDSNDYLNIVVPHVDRIDIDEMLEYIEDKFGQGILMPLVLEDEDGAFTTEDRLVLDVPCRVPIQSSIKGLTISNFKQNMATGAVDGSKITLPEVGILSGLGLEDSLKDFLKARGDIGMFDEMFQRLAIDGSVTFEHLEKYATGTKAKETMAQYFRTICIEMFPKSNIGKKLVGAKR